jgi:hypothetical protein
MVPLYLRVRHYINNSSGSTHNAEGKHWVTKMVNLEGGFSLESSKIEGDQGEWVIK